MRPLANRLGAFLLGLGLLGLGCFTIVECIAVGFFGGFLWIPGRAWIGTLRTTPWSAKAVIAAAALAGLVGLIGLLLELAPRRRRTLPVEGPRSSGEAARLEWLSCIRWEVDRRSLEGALTSALSGSLPGARYRARVRGHGRRTRLRVAARAPRVSSDDVAAAALEQFVRLTGHDGVDVSVKVRRPARIAREAAEAVPYEPDEAAAGGHRPSELVDAGPSTPTAGRRQP